MPEKQLIVDLSTIDFDHAIAGIEDIRKYNPQRYEMEQLTAIVHEDPAQHTCVGYKDLAPDEFWVRGHMPDMPLMPGVVMLEASAQLASYYVQKNNLLEAQIVGFGGLQDVRFRGMVTPGDRLVLLAKLIKVRPKRMLVCRFQGVVGDSIVVEGELKGIPLPVDSLTAMVSGERS